MQIEVVDVGDVPADASTINASAIKAVKNISFEGVIQVLECRTSQKTFPNGIKRTRGRGKQLANLKHRLSYLETETTKTEKEIQIIKNS